MATTVPMQAFGTDFRRKYRSVARGFWSRERDAYVDRRVAQGATYAVIGGELGLTVSAISGRLHRRGRRSEQTRAADALRAIEANLGDPRLTQEGCRWVIGEPPGLWRWCGKPISAGARQAGLPPYCADHAAEAKNPRAEKGKR